MDAPIPSRLDLQRQLAIVTAERDSLRERLLEVINSRINPPMMIVDIANFPGWPGHLPFIFPIKGFAL